MPHSVHILGAGALGRLWAAHMAAAGWQPILLRRNAILPDARILQPLWLPDEALPRCHELAQQTCDHPEPIAHLLIATKAWQSEAALASVRHRLSTEASVLVLQNGLGAQQAIAQSLAPRAVWAASTTDGAWLDEDLGVHHAGQGLTRIGALDCSAIPDWMAALADIPGLCIRAVDDIAAVLLEKVAINSAINGLTALHDCANGALLDAPYWPEVERLCAETETLLQALGQPLTPPLREQVQSVLTLTARNFSSSCQDRRANRPTELAAINGYLLHRAAALGIAMPTHQWLMETLDIAY